jgi:hypothetical protein
MIKWHRYMLCLDDNRVRPSLKNEYIKQATIRGPSERRYKENSGHKEKRCAYRKIHHITTHLV